MTVKFSYGACHLIDNYLASQWDIANHLNGATAAFANTLDDWIDFNVTANPTATTFIHSSGDGDNPTDWGDNTSVYTKLRYRYKVTGTAHAKITAMLHTAGETTVVADGTSTIMTSALYSVPSGDSLDGWRIYNHTGIGHVYVDFLLLHKNEFTLPNVAYKNHFSPPPRDAEQPAPSRITDITQGMGAESAFFDCACNIKLDSDIVVGNTGNWKRVGDVTRAQVIHEVSHELSKDIDFLWLDTGEEQFKARLQTPVFDRQEHRLDLRFKEYSRCNAANYTYIERFGLDL